MPEGAPKGFFLQPPEEYRYEPWPRKKGFFLSTDSENILKSIKTTATTLVLLTAWTESVPSVGKRGASNVQNVWSLWNIEITYISVPSFFKVPSLTKTQVSQSHVI